MKKSTPFQLILLAVFGALGVAGVLVFALVVGGGSGTGVGEVTVWGTFEEARVQAVLRAASETDDRLNGVTYERKDSATFQADLTDALASGTGPDLFFMSQDWAVHDAPKTTHIAFNSLSQTQFQNTFLSAAEPFIGSDGIIAVPVVADPLVLFWNRDLLANAGMTAPPKYWDEFLGAVSKLTVKGDSGVIQKSGLAMGEYRNIANAKDILAILILQAGGSLTNTDPSTGRLFSALAPQQGQSNQASLAALRFYTEFADPSADDYSWNRSLPEAMTAFAQGDVALYVGHASESALIRQTNPNLSFAMAALPQVRSAEHPKDFATVYGLAIPRTARNPQGALTVAYIFASPTISQGLGTVLGMGSALRGVAAASTQVKATEPGTLDALLATAPKSEQDLINSQSYISQSWRDPDPVATDDIFRAMIEDTVSGALKPQDALSRADKSFNQLLGL